MYRLFNTLKACVLGFSEDNVTLSDQLNCHKLEQPGKINDIFIKYCAKIILYKTKKL